MKRFSADAFGQRNYRDGAFQRIGEAALLLRAGEFAGSIYLGGRAVEGMLRALIWRFDPDILQGKKSLDTGHDLRELFKCARELHPGGKPVRDGILENSVQHVGRLRYNNMRFASDRYVERRWMVLGEVHKRRTLKLAAKDYFDACAEIVKRCELLCEK